MHNMLSIAKIIIIIIVGCLTWPVLSPAASLPAQVRVSSFYTNPLGSAWGQERVWVFSQKTPLTDQERIMEITREGEVYARLFFKQGFLREAEERLTPSRTRHRFFSPPLALSDGYPVPYDWLAPKENGQEKISITKQAGNTSFSLLVLKTVKSLDLDTALSRGMVDPRIQPLLSPDSPLELIIISNGEENLIKQLWSKELNWWIYEETRRRKSWIIAYYP